MRLSVAKRRRIAWEKRQWRLRMIRDRAKGLTETRRKRLAIARRKAINRTQYIRRLWLRKKRSLTGGIGGTGDD